MKKAASTKQFELASYLRDFIQVTLPSLSKQNRDPRGQYDFFSLLRLNGVIGMMIIFTMIKAILRHLLENQILMNLLNSTQKDL